MILDQYTSISEKARIFGKKYKRLITVEEFDKWFKGNHGKYFRGINEASFKNYSSAQRLFITHDLSIQGITIDDLVKQQVQSLRTVRDGILSTYFQSLNIEPRALLLLSFAQHQKKGIAPLLDFTLDRRIALFFMADGCDFEKCGSANDKDNSELPIKDFASLYYLTSWSKIRQDSVLEKHLGPKLQSLRSNKLERLGNSKYKDDSNYRRFVEKDYLLKEKRLKATFLNHLLSSNIKDVIIDSTTNEDNTKDERMYRIMISNLNITAQKGCFVYHNDGLNPFEDMYCVDIHKSLIPYIRNNYLLVSDESKNKRPITRNYVYPDSGAIVEESVDSALSEVIKR